MRGAAGTLRSGRVSVLPRRRLGPVLVGVLFGGARVVGNGTDESANSGREYTGWAPTIPLGYEKSVCGTRRGDCISRCGFWFASTCASAESWQQGRRWDKEGAKGIVVVIARPQRRPAGVKWKGVDFELESQCLQLISRRFPNSGTNNGATRHHVLQPQTSAKARCRRRCCCLQAQTPISLDSRQMRLPQTTLHSSCNSCLLRQNSKVDSRRRVALLKRMFF